MSKFLEIDSEDCRPERVIAILKKLAKKDKSAKRALEFMRAVHESYRGPYAGIDVMLTKQGVGVQVSFRVSRTEVRHAVFPKEMTPLFREEMRQRESKTKN